MTYQFIDTDKANYPIYVICDVPEVPQSPYFPWAAPGRRAEAKWSVLKRSWGDPWSP